MKCLCSFADCGSGIELISNMLLDILKRTNLQIDYYFSQCMSFNNNVDLNEYNLIIVNDNDVLRHRTDSVLFDKVVYIAHGTVRSRYPKTVTFNPYPKSPFHYIPITFSPGNKFIFNSQNKTKEFICLTRINKIKNTIMTLANTNIEIDFYSQEQEEFLNNLENIENFHFKGYLPRKEILKILPSYKGLIISSYDECLCIPVYEALLSGVVPVMISTEHYFSNNRFLVPFESFMIFGKPSHEMVKIKLEHLERSKEVIQTSLSYDRFILSFLTVLRGLSNLDIRWTGIDKQANNICKDSVRTNRIIYDNCSVDFSILSL